LVAVTVIEPVDTPAQAVGVDEVLTVKELFLLIVTLMVLLHVPVGSVTTTICGPGPTFVNVYGLPPLTGVPPSS
jgi:hypothetical protein